MLTPIKQRIFPLNKSDSSRSWFSRIKQILCLEPKNKESLIDVLRQAQMHALIDTETLMMTEGVILLSQMKARDIMLPKNQMTYISEKQELHEIIKIITVSGHSRFPVTGSNDAEIIGILHAKDLLRFQMRNEASFDLNDLMRQAFFVPESKKLNLLLTDFRNNRNHMAIVVDEYGVPSGFITLEDIIEQIIGDIEDEFDIDEESYIKVHGAGHYMLKALTPISELNETLHTDFSDFQYDTIGGIVMANFGRLPKRGEIITINHFEFKVINADARHIKLLECFDLRPEQR
jgi:magnesium and cobalt transporter